MAKALIVVDVQKDFCEGGSLAVGGGDLIAERIADHLTDVEAGTLLVFTKDFHLPDDSNGGHIALPPAAPDFVDTWPPHCIQGTEGADLHDALAEFNTYMTTFYKGIGVPAYSGFQGRAFNAMAEGVTLGDFLRSYKVTDVDVCGIAADYCVKATAYDGREEGFNVTILPWLTVGIHTTGEQVAKEFAA